MTDHYFLIEINSNFLSAMLGFRDNAVLLPNEYDVIMISSLEGASGDFSRRIPKERP